MANETPVLSVILPALNEEEHIEDAIATVRRSAAAHHLSVEAIVVNDGSTDRTGEIAEKKADRVIHHTRPMGMGQSYFDGVDEARGRYVILIPGDNEIEEEAVKALFGKAGQADIINAYSINPEVRPFGRRILSWIFVRIVWFLSGVRLKYFSGPSMYRTDFVRKSPVRSWGFGFNAEMLTYLIRRGASVVEVPMRIKPQPGRRTRAFKFSNWMNVSKSLLYIFFRRCQGAAALAILLWFVLVPFVFYWQFRDLIVTVVRSVLS